MKIEITDEDIKNAEAIFLKPGQSFDNERIEFIKCLDESLYVQACPGSGKTTALLAKLYILSEKMLIENNRGICVLTHTNVAIDLIKKKIGEKADKLFNYPNYFGTIQSLVDKYLAIPSYIKCFGYRPNFIDEEMQRERMSKTYYLKGIYNQTINNLKIFNYAKNIFGKYTIIKEDDNFIIIDSKTREVLNIKRPRSKIDWNNNEKAEILKAAVKLKIKVVKEDKILSFDDAYDFGSNYLHNIPEIINLFSSRFKYVFIDEAQDTSAIQKEIIDRCFDDNVFIQWVGDVNQGIMNDNYSQSAWNPDDHKYKKLKFTKSLRVSQPIADIIKNVAVNKYPNLQGTSVNLAPVIIIFDDNTKNKVLEKFAELLVNKKCLYEGVERSIYEISKLTGNPIKAIGWVGKEKDEGLTIKSYFPDFNKKNISLRKTYFPNLYTMCQLSKNVSPKIFKESVLACIIESLYLSDIKNSKQRKYSKTEFLNELREKNEKQYNALLTGISKYIANQNFQDISQTIFNTINSFLLNSRLNQESINYLLESKLVEVEENIANASQNIDKVNINGEEIEILIDTVHGVKGETHTATLYLETKFYKNSFQYFKDELIRNNSSQKLGEREAKALKISHVAFSRPTHLLCISIHKNDIENLVFPNYFELQNITY